ncbi:RmlD substrate binding domain protein [Rubripirellula tenax]|uniref:RmlD substrate binding domain protein n=1 Tax=Rubripirellula tenax TaxID=2528015 RepID=A0A5C6EGF9_9BACT|nr:NAD-dependent epimerase/dehydratase family protein [Rubripirellula tenax]TWU47525.1 RmlD substrate binding domain protein [Rubripirellula tenax]
MNVAVLGANGQVGAELCLILDRSPSINVIPISRTKLGSAFLRYRGIACRHGNVADASQAGRLLGDCDAVVNLALPSLADDLASAKDLHNRLIRNSVAFSKPQSTQIYISTMSVYGDHRVDELFPVANLYGKEKARGERTAIQTARQASSRLFIFRLGHVCGELQGITAKIRDMIQSGNLRLPGLSRASNTVFVETIADAIQAALFASEATPGVYNLMNQPQWTWQEVFEYEARKAGVDLELTEVSKPKLTLVQTLKKGTIVKARGLGERPQIRKVAERIVRWLPRSSFLKIKGRYSTNAAASAIAKLSTPEIDETWDALYRRPISGKLFHGLADTSSLLVTRASLSETREQPWPSDLLSPGIDIDSAPQKSK